MLEKRIGARRSRTAFPVRTLLKPSELQQNQPVISVLKTSEKNGKKPRKNAVQKLKRISYRAKGHAKPKAKSQPQSYNSNIRRKRKATNESDTLETRITTAR